MSKELILAVDDEADILELVCYNLQKEGFSVEGVGDGEKAIKFAVEKKPQLIVLDLMLPGIDGLEVCKLLKANLNTASISILMLTARGTETDIVAGLEIGADDYIVKPFSPKILVARVKALLRRNKSTPLDKETLLKIENLTMNPARHEVMVSEQGVDLTATEFKLLYLLARTPGIVFTRNQIVHAVHGKNHPVTDRSVDVQVVGLRKKLGSLGVAIETVRGVGYRFRDEHDNS